MEIIFKGDAYCDWCNKSTSMPAKGCIYGFGEAQDDLDCLCDNCSNLVEVLKRRIIIHNLINDREDVKIE